MGDVRVQFLGSGGPFASGGRFQSCILIESDQGRYLIDCGMTALVAMARFDIDPGGIDAMLISHLHGDHFGGLPLMILEAMKMEHTIAAPAAGTVTEIHFRQGDQVREGVVLIDIAAAAPPAL